MKASQVFNDRCVLVKAEAEGKKELLELLITTGARELTAGDREGSVPGVEAVRKAIVQRERQGSTGVGEGLAFPHARMSGVEQPVVVLATLTTPVEFGSIDGQPVDVACMILAPDDDPTICLRLMAQVGDLLSRKDAVASVRASTTCDELLKIFQQVEISLDVPVRARQIMRQPVLWVKPDQPVREVTRAMLGCHLEAVPVVADNGRIVGQITTDLLFRYGLPDFFSQLKSVAFISEFDPFEKYFERESTCVAADIMSEEFCQMPASSTLLEVVFALTVQNHPKIYLTNSHGSWCGVIDRIGVLDRVLNL